MYIKTRQFVVQLAVQRRWAAPQSVHLLVMR